MSIFKFFCDESYDSDPLKGGGQMHQDATAGKPRYIPRTFVVGGFFSGDEVWGKIEDQWKAANERAGVKRFHAANVNSRTGEFVGWTKNQQLDYSKELIQILHDQGRSLTALSTAIKASDYYATIDEQGRKNMGSHYIACFNSCVALIAQEMEVRGFPPEDKFAIILDRNHQENEAVEAFYRIKDGPEFPYRHRLATCIPGATEAFVPLECADLIAYETFRLLDAGPSGNLRKALEIMFQANGFLGHALEREQLLQMKQAVESAVVREQGFIVQHAPFPAPLPE